MLSSLLRCKFEDVKNGLIRYMSSGRIQIISSYRDGSSQEKIHSPTEFLPNEKIKKKLAWIVISNKHNIIYKLRHWLN